MTFSQVTTWIYARSLLHAAILGFYYGIWGTLAYATYYLSFLTSAKIVDSARFKHSYRSVQLFLQACFGCIGTACYNFIMGIRLISEVFANLLVISIIFGAAATAGYTVTILSFALATLLYSVVGGLHASLRTDLLQMLVFLLTLLVLLVMTVTNSSF